MRRCALLLWVACLLVPLHAGANGIGHHAEIARRALHFYALDANSPYRDLLLRHTDAFQAGVVFPDWGFAGANPEASEAAHWTPFFEEASRHLRAKPKPWDTASQKLAVFLFGMMSHGVSDLYWHNLGCSGVLPGFLQAMSHQDFSETYALRGYDSKPVYPLHDPRTAHTIGDAGGMVIDIVHNDPRWSTHDFYYPMADLLSIYAALERRTGTSYGVTRQQLDQGTRLQVTLVLTFRRVETSPTLQEVFYGDLYPDMSRRSPFLVDRLEDYFAGGTDSGAVLTAHFWPRLAAWFESEPTGGPFPNPFLFCPPPARDGSSESPPEAVGEASAAVAVTEWQLHAHSSSFSAAPALERETRKVAQQLTARAVGEGVLYSLADMADLVVSQSWNAMASPAYRYAGTSLASGDFDGDGEQEVAIGVPGFSLPGKAQIGGVILRSAAEFALRDGLDPRGEASVDLVGVEAHARFGQALAVVDLNADGRDDLAVSSPATGTAELRFRGKVYVYFGTPEGLPNEPDLVLAADADRSNFGWHLEGIDLDGDGHGDLLVGAPFADGTSGQRQAGRLFAYLASTQNRRGTSPTPTWTLHGQQPLEAFGSSVALVPGNAAQRRLVVGAPGAKWLPDQHPTAGMVYGYSLDDPRQPRLAFSLRGQDRYGRLGAALAYGDPGTGPVLAIAAPSPSSFDAKEPQRGTVWLVSVAELHGHRRLDQVPVVTRFTGAQDLARFGWKLVLDDLDGDGRQDLLVSEPHNATAAGLDAGALYAWFGGDNFPTGSVSADAAPWRQASEEKRARLGYAATVARTNSAILVLVGAPRSSTSATLAGGVKTVRPSNSPGRSSPD